MENITSGSIRFTAEGIQEVDGNQVAVSVPRKEIKAISLCYGQSVEKPIFQFIAGILICALGFIIGVWPSLDIILNHQTVGTPIILKTFAFAAPLIVIGVAVIIPIFRKSHYLFVVTNTDKRKLTIRKASPVEVINSAEIAGYKVLGPTGLKP